MTLTISPTSLASLWHAPSHRLCPSSLIFCAVRHQHPSTVAPFCPFALTLPCHHPSKLGRSYYSPGESRDKGGIERSGRATPYLHKATQTRGGDPRQPLPNATQGKVTTRELMSSGERATEAKSDETRGGRGCQQLIGHFLNQITYFFLPCGKI